MSQNREIFFNELVEAVKANKLTVVDVRNRHEIEETGKIPNSHCVPLPEVKEAFSLETTAANAFKTKYGFDRPNMSADVEGALVLTCRSGRRVQMAADELAKLGFGGFALYRGSFLDWTANNGPVEK